MNEGYRILQKQLSRPLTVDCQIVVKCPQGYPAVTENKPLDKEGRPFPTLYWLSCPLAVKKCAQLEAASLIKKVEQKLQTDERLRTAFLKGVSAYQQRREQLAAEKKTALSEAFLKSGIGGSSNLLALKCLHAHLAHFLATGQNPVGEILFKQLAWQNCHYCKRYESSSH